VFFIAAYFIIALGAYTMIEMREKFQSIEPSGRYAISQVFVAHKKGTLMAHALTREAKKCVDADVMVGMLTAIQDFVKESFEGEKHHKLDELKYGDVRLIFRRGNDFMLVAVLSGQLTNVIQAALDDTIKKVEENYGTVMKDWDGNTRTVDGIKDIVAGLLT
jgi:OOP family OmpA-OmpF porin